MIDAPVLAHPDFPKPFVLDTDASDVAIGGVVSQNIDCQERAVAFASRTLTETERRYCVTRKELLALVHFVKYFKHYLYGKVFTARTDHGSLRWLTNFKDPVGQITRWLEILSSYSMKIEHRPGRLQRNADGLSRRPCKQCGQKIPDEVELKECVNQVSLRDETESVKIKDTQSKDKDVSLEKSWFTSEVKPAYKDTLSNSSFLNHCVVSGLDFTLKMICWFAITKF